MGIQVNIGGTQHTVTNPQCNVGGVWHNIGKIWVNVGGTWRDVWQRILPFYSNSAFIPGVEGAPVYMTSAYTTLNIDWAYPYPGELADAGVSVKTSATDPNASSLGYQDFRYNNGGGWSRMTTTINISGITGQVYIWIMPMGLWKPRMYVYNMWLS